MYLITKIYHNYRNSVIMLLFFVILWPTSSSSAAQKYSENEESASNCHKICGCDRAFIYNDTMKECVVNMKYIFLSTRMTDREYNDQDHDIANDDGMSKKLRVEADKVFRGIIISVLTFMACASLCTFSACIYCCHINYSDRKLKNDVKAIAKKLKTEYHSKKTVPKKPLEPIEESCNVMVGNAGVFVV